MKKDVDLIIYSDGGSRGNPGNSAYGFVVYDNKNIIYKTGKKIGVATNNVAEYCGVIFALEWVLENYKSKKIKIYFFLDSQLVVSQLKGIYKIKNENIKKLVDKVKDLTQDISITYTLIPREKNKEADELVNLALDEII